MRVARAIGMLWMARLALWCIPFSVFLSRLDAHAWVECEGKVVVGGDVSAFIEFRHASPSVAS